VRVTSAGTNAVAGKRADPRAIAAAEEHGIDLHSHQARPLTRELVEDADLVVGMDYVNEAAIIALAPNAVRKTVLLGAFREASDSSLEIEDPYAGDIDHVRRCYATLDRCVTGLVRELRDRTSIASTWTRGATRTT
jgi:low molecular weight protein-tyrosine phosphatase